MKIKLALLDNDTSYLNRIVTVFGTRYADKFEIYSFTDPALAMETLERARIDILIASDVFHMDAEALPNRCGFAYFVESSDVDSVKDQRAICKFQKADLIYKQILSIYSEKAENLIGIKMGDNSCKFVTFLPASGGTGASTMAASAAIHWASKGKKILYLNFECCGSSDLFFSGEGQFDMSDIIYALKSKKANLLMKLESCVKQDVSGVFFYSQPKVALDMMELTTEDILRLIAEINVSGSYDAVVIDMDLALDQDYMDIYQKSNVIVMVGDGSDISNSKLEKTITALRIKEQGADSLLTDRMQIIYNKFSNKTGKVLENLDITNIGGAPRFQHATVEQVLRQLAQMDMFDKII